MRRFKVLGFVCMSWMFWIVGTSAASVKFTQAMDPDIVRYPGDETTNQALYIKCVAKLEDGSILIGGMNFVAKFDKKTNSWKNKTLNPTDEEKSQCSGLSQDVKCENHILSLIVNDDNNIYACGTYAKKSRCWLMDENLDTIEEKNFNFLPALPKQNLTVISTGGSSFLYGSDKIYNEKRIKTSEKNFRQANFVSSYNFDDYTYFFLREVAEIGEKRKHVFSRVARLCKMEMSKSSFNDIFTSVLKAKLICKKSGTIVPVYYDEIQATSEVVIGNERYIYAAFSTSSDMGSDSAVCRYRVKDIVDAFVYSDLQKEDGTKYELTPKRNTVTRGGCNVNSSRHLDIFDYDLKQDVQKNILLFDSINSVDKQEALYTVNTRLTSLSDDEINGTTILFLGAVDGFVYKIAVEQNGVRLLEKVQPFQNTHLIYEVKAYNGTVYVGGPNGMAQFGVARCASNVVCNDCLFNQDPYCVWAGNRCERVSSSKLVGVVTAAAQCPVVPDHFNCTIKRVGKGALECNLLDTGKPTKNLGILNWKFESKDIAPISAGYSVTTEATKSVLIIKDRTIDLRGNYKCVIGNAKQKNFCQIDIEERDLSLTTLSPLTTNSLSETTTDTVTTPTTTITTTTHKNENSTDPVTTVIIPVTAPSGGTKKPDYFVAFIGTLILLLLILISLLAVVLYRNCQRRKSSKDHSATPTKSPVSKINGVLSPSKKKYDVIQAGGGATEKPPPEVCIEMSEDAKLLPESSPTISSMNGDAKKANDNVDIEAASDEKGQLEGGDEKDSLVVDT